MAVFSNFVPIRRANGLYCRRMRLSALLLVGALAAAGACTPSGTLVAPTGQRRFVARDDDSGVSVVVTTGAWQGQPATLDREFTVAHVLVANMGSEPILLAPGDFELRDLRGFRYTLLDIGASFRRVVRADGSEDYRDQRGVGYDPGTSERFQAIDGSPDMAAHALPWGVLEPGTQMRGYIYFEPLEHHANGGTLTWHMQTPDHRAIAEFNFDLRVARGAATGSG